MVSFSQFLDALASNPFLAIVMVLIIGSIFVNGSTDAANAIAESVGTRSIGIRPAIVMSVVCNFVGLVGMTLISTAVADTISGMVDFGGDNHAALIALAAATVAIVAWGVGAWAFGIPTSESHALIAGLTGAAIAVHGDLGGSGLPVSTTHAKTAAIMGAGSAKDVRSVNWSIAKDMVLTWVLTFPGCGLIGYLMAKLFLHML